MNFKVEDPGLSPKTSRASPTSPEKDFKDETFLELEALAGQRIKERKVMRDGDAVSIDSASQTLMSKHALNMGFYTINLGRLHF